MTRHLLAIYKLNGNVDITYVCTAQAPQQDMKNLCSLAFSTQLFRPRLMFATTSTSDTRSTWTHSCTSPNNSGGEVKLFYPTNNEYCCKKYNKSGNTVQEVSRESMSDSIFIFSKKTHHAIVCVGLKKLKSIDCWPKTTLYHRKLLTGKYKVLDFLAKNVEGFPKYQQPGGGVTALPVLCLVRLCLNVLMMRSNAKLRI